MYFGIDCEDGTALPLHPGVRRDGRSAEKSAAEAEALALRAAIRFTK